ncbi:MAG: SDR family NAD(P)-dependent oxidoreductase [Acidobacteriota bacterium]
MSNQVSLITGASSGIGRALALELGKDGARLAIAARRRDLLDELATETGKPAQDILVSTCDVASQKNVKETVAAAVERFGRIDLAILAAGVGGKTNPLKFHAGAIENLISINLLGVAYCLEELIPLMLRQGGGTIAVISSIAADRGIPDSAAYCASKAAVSTLCEGLRGTLRKHNVRLVTIEPGYVRTAMTEGFKRMPFVMEADEAARLILRRIKRGDRVIRFPLLPSLFMKLVRLVPNVLFDAATGGKTIS